MATEIAKQATVEELSPHNIVKASGIQIHTTQNGDVAFINTDYVSQKLINIMVQALNDERYISPGGANYGHGVFAVVFRIDGMTLMPSKGGTYEEVPWLWVEASKAIVCNIKRCVSLAFEQALSTDVAYKYSEHMNVKIAVWQHLIAGFFHECHHAEKFMDDAMKLLTDKKAMKKSEEDADEFARMMMYDMAKTTDIEPMLGTVIDAMYKEAYNVVWEDLKTTPEKELTEKDKQYMLCQEHMNNTGDMWYLPAPDDKHDDHIIRTFKEVLHHFSGDDMDDPSWKIDTKPAHVEQIVYNNKPSNEAADGTPGVQSTDEEMTHYDEYIKNNGAYREERTPAAGFQGAVQSPGAQQQMRQEGTPTMPTNMPKAPGGAHGQPNGFAKQNQDVVVGANTYMASKMSQQQFQQVVANMYGRIYVHIFKTCGFNPTYGPGNHYFMQGAKIVEAMMLTPEEQTIVHGMECYDENGRPVNSKVNGWISGKFMDKEMKLPGYSLTMSDINGCQIKRKFIPQNPWKTNNSGAYTQTALLAQQGTCIMWIINPEATDKQYAARINNGIFENNNNGSWQRVC